MSNIKKLMMSAAGGEALNVEDVFSTYLYTGNSASQPINNGVDLAGKGGMVWAKARDASYNHLIWDSERGSTNGTAFDILFPNLFNVSNSAASYGVTSFNSNGFTLGPSGQQSITNQGGASYGDIDYASWTWRKAPKFFDVVTWTGDGSTNSGGSRLISHGLGSVPGFIIVKRTSSVHSWYCYHRELGATKAITLNSTGTPITSANWWYNVEPTSTNFSVNFNFNGNNETYVAYLFAHNDGDGEFGPDGDQDIIKCGSYTGNGSSQHIDLGFEPQWILHRRSSDSAPWRIYDVMRGMSVGGEDAILETTSSSAEFTYQEAFQPTATGFTVPYSAPYYNASGNTYIYMAIRRGTKVPESATDVFTIDTQGSTGDGKPPAFRSTFPVDIALNAETPGGGKTLSARLTGTGLIQTNTNNAEVANAQTTWDFQNGIKNNTITYSSGYAWMWKRAPGFCDALAFTAGIDSNRRLEHSLGVAPEMIWVKRRDGNRNWYVYHKDLGDASYGARDYRLYVNSGQAKAGPTIGMWGTSDPTSTDFGLSENDVVGVNGSKCIAYLFASLDGISKVGSYTGNGSSQTIDCGFSSGARFVLIKCATVGYDWQVFDTERGIVSGNDPKLALNTTQAQQTNVDFIDPVSSGFAVTSLASMNANGETFIFYAIA